MPHTDNRTCEEYETHPEVFMIFNFGVLSYCSQIIGCERSYMKDEACNQASFSDSFLFSMGRTTKMVSRKPTNRTVAAVQNTVLAPF